ncbi:hypothetical protein ACIBO2_11205 [Nonomuraea sp. NPDC050022]|uniref:hypothetical protein n=1 Tax=unclassified Nonomuraea TaxID=2593643 RepID=UPI0034040A5D
MMWEEQFATLSAVAARQSGLITEAQAGRLGIDKPALLHFAESGLLVELDWAVYQLAWSAMGPRYAYPLAAWLAIMPESFRWERSQSLHEDAVLSHESACGLHGLGSEPSPLVTFTVPEEFEGPRATKMHVAALKPDEVGVVEGIPVTTPARTIVDLAAGWAEHGELRRVLMDAVQKDLVDLRRIHADLAPLAGRQGFPEDGREFVAYFLPDLDPAELSARNQRGYAALAHADRVADLQSAVARLIPEGGDEALSWDIAAEIIGRS